MTLSADVSATGSVVNATRLGEGEVLRAYNELRERILDLTFVPGEVLPNLQLTRQLGVGRTPLREAIRMLQSEGLMTLETNHRPRVTPFRPEELDALYAMRILSNSLALELTMDQLTEQQLERMQQAAEASALALRLRDMEAFKSPHNQFHALLAAHANGALQQQLKRSSESAERFVRMYTTAVPNARSTGADDHLAIFDAVQSRKSSLAVDRLAMHLARTALQVMAQFAPEFEPRATRQALRIVRTSVQGSPAVIEGEASSS